MRRHERDIPWYEEWFDENYLLLYCHRDIEDAGAQVRLIIDTIKPGKDSSILDLGCGEGRYTEFFHKRGFRVVGLDLSEKLLGEGRRKYPDLHLVKADMRAIPGTFDLVLSLFTSFGYFEEEEENQRVFHAVYRSLRPGGVFWLDFLNPAQVEKNLVPESYARLSPHLEVEEKRKIEADRIIKDIYFKEKESIRHYRESVRLYTRPELEDMFLKAGFCLDGCFGDYRGRAWHRDSERTIIYGRRPA